MNSKEFTFFIIIFYFIKYLIIPLIICIIGFFNPKGSGGFDYNMRKEIETLGYTYNKYNGSYEKYVDKEILGIDLASLINQVVNENEKNDVQKNQNGYYIDNGIDSIKIDLKMITIV